MTKIVLIGSSGNAAVRPYRFPFFTFQYVLGFEWQKQNVSFPFAPFGLPSKCKKGNDNYTFVTTYYSNFGELIALMRPTNRLNGSMLLYMNVERTFHAILLSLFLRNILDASMRINHFIAFALYIFAYLMDFPSAQCAIYCRSKLSAWIWFYAISKFSIVKQVTFGQLIVWLVVDRFR